MKHLYPFLCLFLAACGPPAGDTGPGGVSVEDARALDAAAAKLDAEARISAPPTTPALNPKNTEQPTK